jgi:hypothetical protein
VDCLPDNELPSPRADVDLVRERTGIRIEGSAGPLKGKLQVTTDGLARSPVSTAVTMLLLGTAACVPAIMLGAVGWLIHVPALPLGVAVLGLFGVLFATGTILAFRAGRQPAPAPRFRRHVIVRPVCHEEDNGSALPRGHESLQNESGTGTGAVR